MRYYYKHINGQSFLNLKHKNTDNNYIEITEQEFNELTKPQEVEQQEYVPTTQDKINALKSQLNQTDYKALKYAEGELTDEEYAPIKEQRRELRKQIKELEATL